MNHRWIGCLVAVSAFADTGVLLPRDKTEPDAAVLALDEMAIRVVILNGNAKINIRQVFSNRQGTIQEGTYNFALPQRALISDFAVWDDVTRIPGVILERKRADELYTQIRAQSIDPGLLQQGERGDEESRNSAVFTAKVTPIPAYGNKRLEIEYQERIPVDGLQGYFAIPLSPDTYKAQTAGKLTIDFELKSHHRLKDFRVQGKVLTMKVSTRTPNHVVGYFEGSNVQLTEDLAIVYTLDGSKDSLEVAAYRDGGGSGYFEASALLSMPKTPQPTAGSAKTVLALFDASVSMQWQKLQQSYQALEQLLKSLGRTDQFNVVVYNSEAAPFAGAPVAATPDQVEKALAFVKSSRLRGGTNVQAALDIALKQSTASNGYIVFIGDGGATRGIINTGKLGAWYASQWNLKPEVQRPRTYVFGVGDDANLTLLRSLAKQNGVFTWIRSTESMEFPLKAFLSKIGQRPVENLRMMAPAGAELVYPLDETAFPGSSPAWVGQYSKPGRATFAVAGLREGQPVSVQASVNLPTQSTEYPYLPREWAKARVDALLDKINRDGEDQSSIDEIIRLSRKYKFVTPYTSFLAAPRSLLRPRLIRPGDPVLRIRTDPAIKSVVAVFPFGLVKPLRYLQNEDVWQTRFLAPDDMKDGTYYVQLLLRDDHGSVYRESKSFVIVSQGPLVRVKLDKTRYRGGESLALRVSASATTRTITARLYGAMPAQLRWNPDMKSSTGSLIVPYALPAGKYNVTVTAEDFAHNVTNQEVPIEVVP